MGTETSESSPLPGIGANDGSSDDVDTVLLEQLPEPCDSEATLEMTERPGVDPYSNRPAPARPREHRRTLDDMRKLDEEIKRTRTQSPAHAPPTTDEPRRLGLNALRGALARWFRDALRR